MKTNKEKGRRLALELIKDRIIGKYSYIVSSSNIIDDFTLGFCEVLEEKGFQYNISALWMQKEKLDSINETIYPIIRQYIEPVKNIPENIFCFNIPNEISDNGVRDILKLKDVLIIRFFIEQFINNKMKTPNFIKERRSNYL